MTRSSKSLSLYPAKSPKSGFANGFLVPKMPINTYSEQAHSNRFTES
jgi:hypothetical protein